MHFFPAGSDNSPGVGQNWLPTAGTLRSASASSKSRAVETGKSIILILVGAATVIVALGKIAATVFDLGTSYRKYRTAITEQQAAEVHRDWVKRQASQPTLQQVEQKAANELMAMQNSVESNCLIGSASSSTVFSRGNTLAKRRQSRLSSRRFP